MIEAIDISKKINQIDILSNINFTISKSMIVGLLGKNGAGKTTLIEILSNIQKATTGDISINQQPLHKWKNIYGELGVCIEPSLPNYLTVNEYLKQVCILKKLPFSSIEKCIDTMGLEEKRTYRIKNLSFGLKQRVGIASAILGDPDTLILDEPFVGLDPIGLQKVSMYLRERRDEGAAILVSSHQLKDIENLIDSVIYLDNGVIVENIIYADFSRFQWISLATSDNVLARQVLTQQFNIEKMAETDDLLKFRTKAADYDRIVSELKQADIVISSIDSAPLQLENIFIEGDGHD